MKNSLLTNELLHSDEDLAAADGSCFLRLQSDGNLCLYRGTPARPGERLWAALAAEGPTGDHFAILQSDGDLRVHRGKDLDNCGALVWSSGPLAGGPQFVAKLDANNLTIAHQHPQSGVAGEKPLWAARRLRVLTYNTHLMEGSNVAAGAWFKYKLPVNFQDDQRHSFIVHKIAQSGADIVALQEVWSEKRMHQICHDLKHVYPHSALGSTGAPLIADLINLIDHGIPDRAAGSGVVLLSRHPLSNIQFRMFNRPTDDEEKAASKGVLSAMVTVDGKHIQIGMTHAWTDAGGMACPNIADLANHYERTLPALLMGDFNIHRQRDVQQMACMNQIMQEVEAQDSWTMVHGDRRIEDSFTDEPSKNNLAQFFSPERNTEAGDCIDYIYVKNGKEPDGATIMQPIAAEVLRDWKLHLSAESRPAWYWVHEGSVGNMPSATAFGSQLTVVTRMVDSRMQLATLNRQTNTWVHRIIKDGAGDLRTPGAPGMVWHDHQLHLFFQQKQQVYTMTSKDGTTWSPKQPLPDIRTSCGAVPVVYRGKLFLFCRDPKGSQVCYHVLTSDGWSGRKWAGIDTRHDVSAAVMDDKLCIVTIDAGSGDPKGLMRALTQDGERWIKGQLGRDITGSASPGICVHGGRFHVFYREPEGGGIFHRESGDGIGWSNADFKSGQATSDEVCPISVDGKIMLFFSFVVQNETNIIRRVYYYPDRALIYKERALAHMYYPPGLALDASDHYPYQVDIALS